MRVEPSATSSAGVPSKTTLPPSWPAPRAEVDDPVGVCHDRLVVFDDDHGLAGVDEAVEQTEQLLDIGEMEAGGRLVEDVDASLFAHASCELQSLPLAARKVVRGWPSAQIAQPDIREPNQDLVRGRNLGVALGEEVLGFCHGHSENL